MVSTKTLVVAALVLSLCYSCSGSKDTCKWIQQMQFVYTSRRTLMTLTDMESAVSALKMNLPIPHKVYRIHKHSLTGDSVLLVFNAIRNISAIFRGHVTATPCKNVSELMSALHREMKELKDCMKEMNYAENRQTTEWKSLEVYFQKMDDYLKRENYTSDAWHAVCSQVQDHLQRIDHLMAHISKRMN
ncbi:interferon a3-like [Erpetoichthys calabaricus]|uniref:interferon a3-like n=1 Tax=Erpetoichthys calabaricus TaxID=27687 RepID=UPI002234155C|nr:interferon a3-like [Erpetoichthys calabaricus]